MDKSKLKSNGMPLTQGLFLEIEYNKERAVYTLKDEDHELDGVIYPSLKRLYLELEDPSEYTFSNTYLLGWEHWQRICANKRLAKDVEQWRYELELKLRARAIQQIKALATTPKGFQAAKWLADKGWDVKPTGRPSKSDIERETKIAADLAADWTTDYSRINKVY
ncbi:MAG: hypothetical protein ACRCVU_14095 [Flavobacterium sp.]